MATSPSKEDLLRVIEQSTLSEVAEHFGVTANVVNCWLRWNSIQLRPSREELLNICWKISYKEQADYFKVSTRTLSKWKRFYGDTKI